MTKQRILSQTKEEYQKRRVIDLSTRFPSLPIQNIRAKARVEWQHLDCSEKNKLAKQYMNEKPLQKQTKLDRLFIMRSEEEAERKQPEQVFNSDSQVSVQEDCRKPLIKKCKKKNNKNSEYLAFERYYTNRLSLEHPTWSPVQINQIVGLLWKKRKLSTKEKVTEVRHTVEINNKLVELPKVPESAYKIFFKEKKRDLHGLQPSELSRKIGEQWKSLSREQKQQYLDRHQKQKMDYQRQKQLFIQSNGFYPVCSYNPIQNLKPKKLASQNPLLGLLSKVQQTGRQEAKSPEEEPGQKAETAWGLYSMMHKAY